MYWEICLLRRAPQDLPYSSQMMISTLLLYAMVSAIVSSTAVSAGPAILSGIVDVATLVVVTRLVLWALDKGERLLKTLMALAGASIIITVIAMPLLFMQQDEALTSLDAILALGLIALLGWSLAVTAHIMRHALSVPFGGGFIVALGYLFISIAIARTLFATDAPV